MDIGGGRLVSFFSRSVFSFDRFRRYMAALGGPLQEGMGLGWERICMETALEKRAGSIRDQTGNNRSQFVLGIWERRQTPHAGVGTNKQYYASRIKS